MADVVDILGLFKPLTMLLEAQEEPGVVHVLPKLVRLLAK